MFFNHDNIDVYGRAHVYRIKFVSFENKAFSIRHTEYNYIADYEFLKKLEKVVGADWKLKEINKPSRRYTLIILLDIFPDEIRALLKLNNDVLYAFESYFNDNSLHLLAKG